ncbi:hypothetical protein [Ferruginibacter albus]|uniref:hypothetical protein n=1 Tax=Ferruginibacter albus TaxID=2875540 RepID=UPI001CC5B69F|nr:hypothetical protein [Ferruginibacter albus]UAY50912.1 hypothetical protein K9M53_09950 [Ferruginibacter albus]
MRKWKWVVLVLFITASIAYYFLFYKTYSRNSIPRSADIVLAIDFKKNRNTLLSYFLTTPSEWHLGSILKTKDTSIFDWKSALEIPDYIFIFHSKKQPGNIFNCVLTIKDEEEFAKGLNAYRFSKMGNTNGFNTYLSDSLHIVIIKKDDHLLLSTAPFLNDVTDIADELFTQQQFIEEKTIKDILAPSNHFSLYVQKNSFLQNDAILNGNFSNGKLQIDASLSPNFSFTENNFNITDSSLLNIAFTQPPLKAYDLISPETKTKASGALNFTIDSLFTSQHNYYTLDITGIKEKIDSAITYTYDDDFNKIEKVVVNKIQEPSFNFTISQKQPDLFQYWIQNKNIEETTNGNIFTSIPFVKTYTLQNDSSLSLYSYNYSHNNPTRNLNCIAFAKINFSRLPANLLKYFPSDISALFSKLQTFEFIMSNKQAAIELRISIDSKVKDKPFLLSFR